MRRSRALIALLSGSALFTTIATTSAPPATAPYRVATQPVTRIVLRPVSASSPSTVAAARRVMMARISEFGAFGVTHPSVRALPSATGAEIAVSLPALNPADLSVALHALQSQGRLTIIANGSTYLPVGASGAGYPVLATGHNLVRSRLLIGADLFGRPAVDLSLDDAGTSRLATYTASHISRYVAIAIDGRVVTDPIIEGAVTGGQIQIPTTSSAAATGLVATLRHGPLPGPYRVVSVTRSPLSSPPAAAS